MFIERLYEHFLEGLSANKLNQFYNRFDRAFTPPVLPDLRDDIPELFTLEEVYHTLCGVNCRKSCGPDSIPPRVLKITAHVISKPLLTIFSKLILTGTFPRTWKLANIKPIPKCKGASEVKDYRPIALTSTISKCLERLLVKHFQPLVTDNYQFAYRKHKSTEDAVILALDTITCHLDKSAKNYIRGVFIDFTSAFNTICPAILTEKLKEKSLHPNLINWTYSFLTDRQQKVTSDINSSNVIITSTGSPQGCVLSPILFSIYVDDMTTNSENTIMVKYADDTLIMELLNEDQPSNLQHEMTLVSEWCTNNNLILNINKTKEVVFSNARDNPNPNPVRLNNIEIEQVQEYKYLGTIINQKLKFHTNTDVLVRNSRKRLFIMRKLRYMGTSDRLALTCYRTFIESSLLHHAVATYNHLLSKEKHELAKVTKAASKLSKATLPSLQSTINSRIDKKALKLVASSDENPVITFDRLPSGRCRTIKHRIILRANCFKSVAAKRLNELLF